MIDFSTLQGLTIPVMTKRVKLTNLVPAMDSLTFSVGSSSGTCEMSTAHTKYNSKVLCSTGVVGYNEMYVLTSQKFQLIPDHFYYACVEVYQETKLGSVDYFWPSGSPSIFGGQATGNAGAWKKCSNVTTRTSFSAGEYPVRLDFNNGGTAGKIWYDGLMLVDLTEAFGAGNEPGTAWCDANIPYFTGTTTILPLSSPIQASVTQIADASGKVVWSKKQDYWKLFCSDGTTWNGEKVESGSSYDAMEYGYTESTTKQYRVTVDGVSHICAGTSADDSAIVGNRFEISSSGCPASITWNSNSTLVVVTFSDGLSHTLKVESWTGEANWIPFAADGVSYMGEEVTIVGGQQLGEPFGCVLSGTDQYRITIDGVEYFGSFGDSTVMVIDGYDGLVIRVIRGSDIRATMSYPSKNDGLTCTLKIEALVDPD